MWTRSVGGEVSEWEGEEKKYGLMELCTIYGNPSIFVVVLCRMRGIKIENGIEII